MAVVAGDGSEQKRLVLVRGTALSPAWTQQHPIPGPIHWLVLASFAGACGEAEGGPRQQYLRWCVVAPVAGWGLLLINPDDEDALSRGGPARAQTEVEPRPPGAIPGALCWGSALSAPPLKGAGCSAFSGLLMMDAPPSVAGAAPKTSRHSDMTARLLLASGKAVAQRHCRRAVARFCSADGRWCDGRWESAVDGSMRQWTSPCQAFAGDACPRSLSVSILSG